MKLKVPGNDVSITNQIRKKQQKGEKQATHSNNQEEEEK